MKNSKKILSLALTLAMILSAVFCTGVVANAEDTLVPTANDVTKVTFSTTEADMDWSLVGPNLIPDSTVSEFNEDGTYKKYYTEETYDAASQNSIANPNAWWASTTEANMGYNNGGNSGYKGIGALASGTTLEDSHTDDGTGALVCTTTGSYSVRMLPMNATTANSYYLLSFWIKTTTGSNVTMHFRAAGDNPIKDNVSVATTTGWTRVMYIVSVTTRGLNKVSVVFDNSQDIYIDEVELYKLDGQYAQDCLAAGKLLNGKEGYADALTNQYIDVYSSGKQYKDIDFSAFGPNLFSDPTVSDFNGDTYNANGVFGSGFSWLPKLGGFALNDNSESHTQGDNSGVLKITTTNNRGFALPNFEAKSAYLITFWVKAEDNSTHNIKIMTGNGGNPLDTTYVASNFGTYNEWHRVSIIVSCATATNLGLQIYNGGILYVDDIAVYKLDPEYATKCITAGALISENDLLAETRPATSFGAKLLNSEKTQEFNYLDVAGKNLVPDPTVAQFNEDGTYKNYYKDASQNTTDGKTVVNPDAWWDKAGSYHFSQVLGGGSWAAYVSSPAYRGFVSNDNALSRTKGDGSGALVVNSSTGQTFAIPDLEKRNYYLLTLWVKTTNAPNAKVSLIAGTTALVPSVVEETIPVTQYEWNRISYIIRTEDVLKDRFVRLNISSLFYVDDVSLYKLDYDYGKACYDAGEMLSNTEAMKKDAVGLTVESGKSTVDATVADGYFVPYGAFATQDNKMAEKLGNGRFYVENAGDYSYTQFKYPTGIVGTYGASAKTDADDTKTGIQFGSLITDNLSIDKDGAQGTLVFRDTDKGTFEEFRATFPTKTRKELAAEIYAKLKAAEEASSINLANRAVTLNNGGKSVVVMYVPRTTYMWKNSANTELQYAVRVHSIATNYGDVNYTAIGYVTKDGKLEFSNEIKDGVYNELIPAAN